MSFNLDDTMTVSVHRLPQNPTESNPTSGYISNLLDALLWRKCAGNVESRTVSLPAELGFQSETTIYVGLLLTKEARAVNKNMGYKFAWITSAGKLFVRMCAKVST